jgi:single-strand DNA-binding protein
MRCSAWRELGENVVESLTKGMRVMVVGRLRQRSYEHEGVKRTVIELEVDEIGPSLRFARATVKRVERSGGGKSPAKGGDAPVDDPWGGGFTEEPTF